MPNSDLVDRLKQWRQVYLDSNKATLNWVLSRPFLQGVFLNTKMNPITGKDFTKADGWRGPDIILGWIQGRGLEALVMHAAFFESIDQDLSHRLDQAGRTLFKALTDLFGQNNKGYFAYDPSLRPVFPDPSGMIHTQNEAKDFSTFSDVFIVKGLIAAACRYDRSQLQHLMAAWEKIIVDIEENRFIINERQRLDLDALHRQTKDYGPRMIMLGGAALLRELGLYTQADFGHRFLTHILTHHQKISSIVSASVLVDDPGSEICNPGHALEFSGFGLDYLQYSHDDELVTSLIDLVKNHFDLGFQSPGIVSKRHIQTGEVLSPYFPWWSLPETIRAASLAFERSDDQKILQIWEKAHEAFFTHYWQPDLSIATQTRIKEGPVDFVPSTSDLDPGYHTGLSFYSAIKAVDRICLSRS
jgi:hypothetical protein